MSPPAAVLEVQGCGHPPIMVQTLFAAPRAPLLPCKRKAAAGALPEERQRRDAFNLAASMRACWLDWHAWRLKHQADQRQAERAAPLDVPILALLSSHHATQQPALRRPPRPPSKGCLRAAQPASGAAAVALSQSVAGSVPNWPPAECRQPCPEALGQQPQRHERLAAAPCPVSNCSTTTTLSLRPGSATELPSASSGVVSCPPLPHAASLVQGEQEGPAADVAVAASSGGCARVVPWKGRYAWQRGAKPPPPLHTRVARATLADRPLCAAAPLRRIRGPARSNSGGGSGLPARLAPGAALLNPYRMPDNIPHLHATVKAAQQNMGRFRVRRSAVAQLGLYTVDDIAPGELLLEYTGEVIRQPLGDLREARYEAAGLGTYLWALGDGTLVDAARKGNAARFINHSCNPSCIARVVHVEGRARIFIFASRGIVAGEEVTYDYCLSADSPSKAGGSAPVRCNCGSAVCRGSL